MKPTFLDYWANADEYSTLNRETNLRFDGGSFDRFIWDKLSVRKISTPEKNFLYGKSTNDLLIYGLWDVYLTGDSSFRLEAVVAPAKPVEIWGYAGNDHIIGGSFDDMLFGGEGHDRLIAGQTGNDIIEGGAGDDLIEVDIFFQLGDSGGDRTAVYRGNLRDFIFTNSFRTISGGLIRREYLVLTDQNIFDGLNEGRDWIAGEARIQFEDSVIFTNNIHIAEEATGNNVAFSGSGERDIFYGEGGGYQFRGGGGMDIFQFLTAEDSTVDNTTIILDFDGDSGDRLVFADNVVGLTNLKSRFDASSNSTILENSSSGFHLVLRGNHSIQSGRDYYYAGNSDPDARPLVTVNLATGEGSVEIDVGRRFSDPDGDLLSFGAELESGEMLSSIGLGINASTGKISGTFTGSESVNVVVTAKDGRGGSASAYLEIFVNKAPAASKTPLEDVTEFVDEPITSIDVHGAFRDPNGEEATDLLEFEVRGLPEGLSFDESTGEITGVVSNAGDAEVSVSATDEHGSSFSQTFKIVTIASGQTHVGSLPYSSLNGGAGDDNIVGYGVSAFLNGDGGDDILVGFGKIINSLNGNAGDDNLVGIGSNNILNGGSGEDTIAGYGANNNLTGGSSADTFQVRKSMDTWNGTITDFSSGVDKIEFLGFSAGEVSASADGNDFKFSAPKFSLTVKGVNSLSDGTGGDSDFSFSPLSLTANASDQLIVDFGLIVVRNGGAGDDKLIGMGGTNLLNGGADDDCLVGSGDLNNLNGNAGSDNLVGIGDNNVLNGGPGEDTISGLGANNNMTGGAGSDTFQVRRSDESWTGRITDFTVGEDQIEFIGFSESEVVTQAQGGDFLFSNTSSGFSLTVDGHTTLRLVADGVGDYVFL